MLDRINIKQRAKALLKRDYWKAFLISLVIGAAIGGGSGGASGSGMNYNSNSSDNPFRDFPYKNIDWVALLPFLIIMVFVLFVVIFISIAVRAMIGYPLEVGGRRYYIMTAQDLDNKLCFSFAFQSGNYFKIVLSMLLKDVQIFLWSLLFVIPGIIKSYEYRMVPYILAQNPAIGAKRAIELSGQMTKGSKLDIFILDLSFLGWYLLGMLACFVGVLFVRPYVDATMAELYIDLRNNFLDKGFCNPGELNMESAGQVINELYVEPVV